MANMTQLVEICRAALDDSGVRGNNIIIACSGGPDSMALLSLIHKINCEDKIIVAHLNHQLRGPESDSDQEFVEKYCAAHGLKVRTEKINVNARSRELEENLESTARRIRYEWLLNVAQQENARFIATGHHADDQAETVLHHLLRGTGLRGLRGIAPVRELDHGIQLIRPLLGVSRAEIIDFLEFEGIHPREDATNKDINFTRNRIRQKLLPLLANEFDSNVNSHLRNIANHAREIYDWLEAQARAALNQSERPKAGNTLIIQKRILAEQPPVIIRETFLLLWLREGWPMGEMTAESWDRLASLVLGHGTAHDLPGGIHAHVVGSTINIIPPAPSSESHHHQD